MESEDHMYIQATLTFKLFEKERERSIKAVPIHYCGENASLLIFIVTIFFSFFSCFYYFVLKTGL